MRGSEREVESEIDTYHSLVSMLSRSEREVVSEIKTYRLSGRERMRSSE